MSFFYHFKLTLQNNNCVAIDISNNADECIFEELDKDINVKEIKVAIKK